MSVLPGFEESPDTEPLAPVPVARVTERDVFDALHQRYAVSSQGDSIRYAVAEHVRSSASFDARRVCDFMAQDLWLSGGLALHGHEVKVSRSDWLKLVFEPDKADAFRRYCDRWWLVVHDRSIIRDGELPAGWGLMEARPGGRAKVVRPAPRLTPEAHPATFRAALLRATAKTNARRGLIVERAIREARDANERAFRAEERLRRADA